MDNLTPINLRPPATRVLPFRRPGETVAVVSPPGSPAAVRVVLSAQPRQLRVLKCRGGAPPSAPLPLPTH